MIRTPRLLCLALLVSASCLSVDPPLPVRTFGLGEISAPSTVANAPSVLRVSFRAAPLLRQPMVWQLSDVEVTSDELARWWAQPSALVEDAFATYFYDGLGYTPGAHGVRLELHVSAFEGDITESAARARVRLRASLNDGSEANRTTQATFEGLTPLDSRSPDDLARAMTASLNSVLADLATWLEEELAR